jgi:hypothetical protein
MKKIYTLISIAILFSFIFGSCNFEYEYDIESGTDDHTSGSSNVTIDTLSAIDVSMYNQARIFPGLVDTLTERRIIDTTLMFDLNLQYIDPYILQITAVPEPIYSTGLYAGAGELVTIHVDEGTMGLSIQIGSHMDNLSSAGIMARQPVVYAKKALFPGTNTIRNPLGGYIWICREKNLTKPEPVNLKFSGVYKAPDYIAGRNMNSMSWANDIKNTTVPWLELRGKYIAFSVSRARMESQIQENPSFAADMETLLETWDKIVKEYYYNFYGMTIGSNSPQFRAPDFPERVILDIQLENDAYIRWSGQPTVAMNTIFMINELVNFERLKSTQSTTFLSVLGNNYTPSRSWWWSDMINAAKMIPLYRLTEQSYKDGYITTMNDIFVAEDAGINLQFPLALSYAAADSCKFLRKDATTNFDAFALLPIVQLAHYNNNDWSVYSSMYKEMKEGYSSASNQDYLYSEFCKKYGVDFAPFFDHWGISLRDNSREEGAKYPLLDKTIWEYNPLSVNPAENIKTYSTTYKYRHNRSRWDIETLDKDYFENEEPAKSNQDKENMLDGDKSTYWHSAYSDNVSPQLPFYIVVDMKDKTTINGIYFANGERGYKSRRFIIETTAENDIELNDINVTWTKIAEIRPYYDMNNYSIVDGVKPHEGLMYSLNEKFFEFITPQNIRYIRITIPEASFSDSEGTVSHITLAEFGTFYYK